MPKHSIPDGLTLAIRMATVRAREGNTKALDEMTDLITRYPILVNFKRDEHHPLRALADLHVTGSKRLLIQEMAERGEKFNFVDESQ